DDDCSGRGDLRCLRNAASGSGTRRSATYTATLSNAKHTYRVSQSRKSMMQPEQTVLVVEDSRTEVAYLTSVLSHYGIGVRIAEDGLEALQAVDQEHPALIILDINLPH